MLLICLLPLLLLAAEVPDTNGQRLAKNQLYDYRCQQPNGYEAVSHQCDLYVECKKNIAYQQSCPDGLHFNPRVQWPYYPCGYPSEVKCGESDAIQEAHPTNGCSHQYGFQRAPISGDCGSYTLCHEGIPTNMSCPLGLAFNTVKAICDWPHNVPDCDHVIELEGFVCPAILPGEEDMVGKYSYGKSCSHFIACVDGYPRILACDAGLSFDEKSQRCVDAQYVVDCDRSI